MKTEPLVEEQRFEINDQTVALAEERAKNAQMQGQIDTLMAQMQVIMARQAQTQQFCHYACSSSSLTRAFGVGEHIKNDIRRLTTCWIHTFTKTIQYCPYT